MRHFIASPLGRAAAFATLSAFAGMSLDQAAHASPHAGHPATNINLMPAAATSSIASSTSAIQPHAGAIQMHANAIHHADYAAPANTAVLKSNGVTVRPI